MPHRTPAGTPAPNKVPHKMGGCHECKEILRLEAENGAAEQAHHDEELHEDVSWNDDVRYCFHGSR